MPAFRRSSLAVLVWRTCTALVAVAQIGEIVRLVRAYLARPDTSADSSGLWSQVDLLDRRGNPRGLWALPAGSAQS